MQTIDNSHEKAKPFLKWAGGKKQVIDFIEKKLPQEIKDSKIIKNYFEPFLGGGAIFFYLVNNYDIKHAFLGDINQDLILTYNIVKKHPHKLISELNNYSEEYLPLSYNERKEYFYKIRSEFNENFEDNLLRATQMIFLNRTCFNGLYRVNKSGKFNVPMGKYKNPTICDKKNILNVSKALKKVNIVCDDYSNSEYLINENSFVYLDPPYLPIKKTSFTSYNSNNFGVTEQVELSHFCKRIDDTGAKFILSNSDPKNHDPSNNFFKDTYCPLNFNYLNYKKIEVRRSINSKGNKRGPINELLLFNYKQ